MRSILVLEDGSVFEGVSIGASGERIGELVLNTAVVGYQEAMTDPANAGKIMVFTYPLIGNYGAAKKFSESKKVWTEAVIMKEASGTCSNWQAEDTFNGFLEKEGAVAITGLDTRTLAVKLRDDGEMLGIVSTRDLNKDALLKKLKAQKKKSDKDLISKISVDRPTHLKAHSAGPKIAVLDLGMPNSSIKQLEILGCCVSLLPFDTPADEILRMNMDGLVISSGPEGDIAVSKVAATVKKLLGKVPMLGISLGHEIIALALGAKLKKMKIGHHGVNYPVRPDDSYKGEITVQNHSFVVDGHSLKGARGIEITLRNINDNSIEEMESKQLKFIATQYCPASPGFNEVNEVFKRFLKLLNQKERKLEYAKA